MTHILYIEDNEDNIYMLQARLQRSGYTVSIGTDGTQALTMAREKSPALIIMDLRLPHLDGWEATRQLKATEDTRHIPVIGLSAHALVGDREAALAAGCDDFDTKPVEYKRLVEKIEALLAEG